jgi:predicted acyl esterase
MNEEVLMPRCSTRWLWPWALAALSACGSNGEPKTSGESAMPDTSRSSSSDPTAQGAPTRASDAASKNTQAAAGAASNAQSSSKPSAGAAGSDRDEPPQPVAGGGNPGAAGSAGQPAKVPIKLPDGAVSSPGKYSGFGDEKYSRYAISSQYVPVRDGTKLAMDLYRPLDSAGKPVEDKLPVLLMHTPYNRRYFPAGGTGNGTSGESYPGVAARLVPYGYVVAIADFRGVYASYGTNQAYNRGEWVETARFDAYDLVEWLSEQPWSTGKVGMWGCSATGGSQMQAITTAPPHLGAVFPMSCEFDVYPFGVPGGMAPASGMDTKAPPSGGSAASRDGTAVAVDDDIDSQQLRAAIAEHAKGIENPGYVPFRDSTAQNIPLQWWQVSSPHTYLDKINEGGIPLYAAANWDEAATKYGAFFTVNNVTSPSKLIIGPSTHCAWAMVESMTGFDISVEEHRFFDHWLKGVENGVMDEDKVYYWTYNEATEHQWRSAPTWPLPNEQRTLYYLGEKSLAKDAPSAASAHDEARVDYSATATNTASGLVYETPALDSDVRVTGHPLAELWVSSTAIDGDFIATLFDVAPSGTATTYNMQGRLRASLRKETDAPYNNLGLPYHPMNEADVQPLTAGEPTLLRFDLYPISIRFAKGHRIRLVLTFADSTTPRLDPVPTVSVYREAMHQSSLTLPIIPD